MESGKKSLEELTTAGVFHVPEYQRYYSWTAPEWDDFWTDLYTLPPDKQHYFGTIIIQKTDETESSGSTGGYDSSREKPIKLYFRHSPTTESLRNRQLSFRLRLPPARNVHTEALHDGQSFNDVFADYCIGECNEQLREALAEIGVDDSRLGSASALVVKYY